MFRGVGIVLALGCASCSLLFDEGPSGHDAGMVDGPSDVTDARPSDADAGLVCGQPLDNTIDLFEVEDLVGVIDLENSGSSNAKAVLKTIGGSPTFQYLESVAGPPTCGMALGNGTNGFALIENRDEYEMGPISVDFWFRFSDKCGPEKALFSKDRLGNSSGDLTVFCLPNEPSDSDSHVVLRLEDGTGADYLCSGALASGDWHHLVVSDPNDGMTTIKLFVDGLASGVATDIKFPNGWTEPVCGTDAMSKLTANGSPWLWGATGDAAPAGTWGSNRFIGDLDSFRIRAAETTLEQAQAIYQSVIPSE